MLALDYLLATLRNKVVGKTAGLRTLATITRTRRLRTRKVATTTMTHTYSAVDKALQIYSCSLAYTLYLLQRQRALQDHSRKATILQKFGTLRSHITHLCRGVKLHRKPHLAICHILNNKGIHSYSNKLSRQLLGTLQLALIEYGV